MRTSRLYIFGSLFLLALTGGTFGFHLVEGVGLFDSFYFSIITMSTVGYGDIHPWTTGGKLIAICLVFAGVGTFVGVVESVAESVFSVKEERAKREKRNMIRGIFFSDVGLDLLSRIVPADPARDGLYGRLDVNASWDRKRFKKAAKLLDAHVFTLDASQVDLHAVRALLREKSDLLLRLLENPSIGEHEAFSDTLRAIYHLRDEILCRPEDLSTLPASDLKHLGGDLSRVYSYISGQWLAYVRYLKESYPYLFYLAVRTNPFNPEASPIVKE
ncbi:potassium channel family protein [Fundidesulfovibrio terrae]|uniref:potassium channel family protein n=1 Tax=Fundidesulfovibrio terrae TaxID=2922866 RepID=UPI001FAFBB10|nr:potassium channel family protein [Fundidesulfovibrio terrae]